MDRKRAVRSAVPGTVVTLVSAAAGGFVDQVYRGSPVVGALVGAVIGLLLAWLFYVQYQRPLLETEDYNKILEDRIERLENDRKALTDSQETLRTELDQYRRGPVFVIRIRSVTQYSEGSQSKPSALVIPVDVTNIGANLSLTARREADISLSHLIQTNKTIYKVGA